MRWHSCHYFKYKNVRLREIRELALQSWQGIRFHSDLNECDEAPLHCLWTRSSFLLRLNEYSAKQANWSCLALSLANGQDVEFWYLHCKMCDTINAVQLSLHGSLPRAKSFLIWRVKRYLQRIVGRDLDKEAGIQKEIFLSPRLKLILRRNSIQSHWRPFGGWWIIHRPCFRTNPIPAHNWLAQHVGMFPDH